VSDPRIGSVIAGHRIERVLGRGGMGVVYAAVDVALDRTVALKLIAPDLAADAAFRRRFMTESKVAASLDHPNIVPIFRAGEEDGALFLAMRLVTGDDLRAVVARDGPLSVERSAGIVGQVAAALEAAHARGLVHRDVKPANVLVAGDDHCYLTDFGLVKDLAATAGGTQTSELLGTLDYVAPERIQGGATGPWTDVYALGCVLFFALTGSVVFPAETPETKLWAHVAEPPPAPSSLRPTLPRALDAVVARALAKDPRERYDGAPALAAAVRGTIAIEPPDGRLAALLKAAGRVDDPRVSEALGRVAAQTRRLEAAVAEHPPERIAGRLAEVRASHVPGKPEIVDALAQQLAGARRASARLDAACDRLEGMLAEPDAGTLSRRLDELARDLE
jgi:serine/threonine protein kinase